MNFVELLFMLDCYKFDHRRQYGPVSCIYSNFTPRSSRLEGQTHVIFLGLQYFLQAYMMDIAKLTFFNRPKEEVLAEYQEELDNFLGKTDITLEHIAALHDLGYMPLEFCALPEGTHCPIKMPMFTVESTHDDFFWLTNYFETLISAIMWLPCTSATTAYRYKKLLTAFAEVTGDPGFVMFQGHDFSFRGMGGLEAAYLSGMGHLTSFVGTDTVPASRVIRKVYTAVKGELLAVSVAATEHSVMTVRGEQGEFETISSLLDLYPTGILSMVCDGYDFWNVIRVVLPQLKDRILGRDGKVVIRPDSGDPILILCGDPDADDPYVRKGLIECLWDLFGGTVNAKGYKELDPHIGAIYGDAITEVRAKRICELLQAKGFASTNVVFGIGSYTYQYVTRDTHGFAMKATYGVVDGQERLIFKNPKTDNGTKKSAKGRIAIIMQEDGSLKMIDGLCRKEHATYASRNLLQPVWRNGKFLRKITWAEVKVNVAKGY